MKIVVRLKYPSVSCSHPYFIPLPSPLERGKPDDAALFVERGKPDDAALFVERGVRGRCHLPYFPNQAPI